MSTREKVCAWLDSLGIPHADRDPATSFGFDGSTVATGLKPHGRSLSSVVHDGAHWLVASKRRRKVPDFGLGSGPDSGLIQVPTVSVSFSMHEESSASLLGILWESVLGMEFNDTLYDHSWIDLTPEVDNEKVNRELACLQRRGFLKDQRLVEAKAVEKIRNAVKKAESP